MRLRVLVVDDEPLARRRLASLIADIPWAEQVGEAGDGASAIEEATRLRPDAVFLDIQMPELSGLEVVERLRALRPTPTVVFTTAHDQYAVTAFELEAVDYLLKPFGVRRFLTAIERARHAVESHRAPEMLDRAHSLLSDAEPGTLERIFVRSGTAILPLPLSVVERVEAQGDYAMVRAQGGRRYLVGLRIADLEARLPGPPFLRVHRSHLVNLDHVDRMAPIGNSRLEVKMKSGDKVPVSRSRSQEIRRLAR